MDALTPFPLHASIAQARATPNEIGRQSAKLMQHGTMQLRYYAPGGKDAQTPHSQDEIYIVWKGEGWFVKGADGGETRTRFTPGDALFVPAGIVHRFAEFSDDLEVWVVFYGPPGGEFSARLNAG